MIQDQTNLPFPGTEDLWETKGVFSDHYLRRRLKESGLWPDQESSRAMWRFCKETWEKKRLGLGRGNEELTKQEFLEPVLTKLGYAFQREATLPGERKHPDFLLFPDEETKDSAFGKDMRHQYQVALTVVEAKKVNHPLGAPSKRETPRKFPHQQIRGYLEDAIDDRGYSYFDWAILTNGNLWRLYCRHVPSSAYFEFDLARAIEALEDFSFFVALLSPKGFVRDSEGKCPLDYIREEALQVQTALEEDLRKRILAILEELANGFFNWHANHITEADLPKLYENCLIFLYRLLFVLYCEGRELLPIKPSGPGSRKAYRDRYSLARLQSKVRNPELNFEQDLTDLYEKILALFSLVNGDQPSRNKACNVPRYNGGLFSHEQFPMIDEWRIGEITLARVLRGLIYSDIPAAVGQQHSLDFGETIDYADLEVRQLGSIYEGLLEHHLEIEGDRVVLRADQSSRKSTGTYYTPDFIVQYIVEYTLQPLCDRIEELPNVTAARQQRLEDNSFAEEVLKLNILDPAMGSGHFLVRATEFLADQIVHHPTTKLQVEKVKRGFSHEEAELSYWRRRVVESCIYGVDVNPLAVELSKLSLWLTCIAVDQPLSFLDHHFRPGNSLVGAKLSELGHLPVKKKTTQISFTFGPDLAEAVREAIAALEEIEGTQSRDVAIVKDKEQRWKKEVRDRMTLYRTVFDLWTSTLFGLSIKDTEYHHLAKVIISKAEPRTKEARVRKRELAPYKSTFEEAKRKYFFHWELEFPEVFFHEDGSAKRNAGFDAVIGNPPYIRIQQMKKSVPLEVDLYKNRYDSASKGNYDVYVVFVEKALSLLNLDGILGFILPHKFFTAKYGEPLRHIVSRGKHLSHVVHFGAQQVFEHGTTYTCLLFLKKRETDQFEVARVVDIKKWRESREAVEGTISAESIRAEEWNLVVGTGAQLFNRLAGLSTTLGDVSTRIYQGSITGADKVFLFKKYRPSEQNGMIDVYSQARGRWLRLESDILKPVVRSGRIRRYYAEPSALVLFPYEVVNRGARLYSSGEIAAHFPLAWDYLSGNKNLLRDREKGKFKDEQWYQFSRTQNLGMWEQPKLLIPYMITRLSAHLDTHHNYYFVNVTTGGYGLTVDESLGSLSYICGLMNSLLLDFYFRAVSTNFRGGYFAANKQFIERLPIRTIKFSDPTDKSRHDAMVELVDQMLGLHERLADAQLESQRRSIEEEIAKTDREIDQRVYDLYKLTDKEIKVVEESTRRA